MFSRMYKEFNLTLLLVYLLLNICFANKVFTIISVSDIVLPVLIKLWLKFTSWSIFQKNHARPNVVDRAPYIKFLGHGPVVKTTKKEEIAALRKLQVSALCFFVDYSTSCVAWSGAAYVDK